MLVRDSYYVTRIIYYEGIISISDSQLGDSMDIMNILNFDLYKTVILDVSDLLIE